MGNNRAESRARGREAGAGENTPKWAVGWRPLGLRSLIQAPEPNKVGGDGKAASCGVPSQDPEAATASALPMARNGHSSLQRVTA